MGAVCLPCAPLTPSAEIDHKMDEFQTLDKKTTKLLLLGTGDVGKTTFFRQFQLLYGEGITAQQRHGFRGQIHFQCIQQMKSLASGCLSKSQKGLSGFQLSDGACTAYNKLCLFEEQTELNSDRADIIETLWNDDGVKKGFDLGTELGVVESSEYFWNHIRDIAREEWVPSDYECVLLRSRSTGMFEFQFVLSDMHFLVVDVGGQRSEQKKWIHVFDNVSAILWVASLSAYCEVLFEDTKQNSMKEQLSIFQQTINLDCFERTSIILFLNKSDLFQEKIHSIPLRHCFPEYDGLDTFEDAVAFVSQTFKASDERAGRDFFVHMTTATDTNNVQRVFADVTLSIIQRNTQVFGVM